MRIIATAVMSNSYAMAAFAGARGTGPGEMGKEGMLRHHFSSSFEVHGATVPTLRLRESNE